MKLVKAISRSINNSGFDLANINKEGNVTQFHIRDTGNVDTTDGKVKYNFEGVLELVLEEDDIAWMANGIVHCQGNEMEVKSIIETVEERTVTDVMSGLYRILDLLNNAIVNQINSYQGYMA